MSYRYSAAPKPSPRTPSEELDELAAQLEELRYDNRSPSNFYLGKIDIERGMRRVARALEGRR